jgi:hypothetical protein
MSDTQWDRADGLVLIWVHEKGDSEYSWEFSRREPFSNIPQLSGADVNESLRRLHYERLIEGKPAEADNFVWTNLRPTAEGLRTLNQWPGDPEDDALFLLARVLETLIETSDQVQERSRLRSALDFLIVRRHEREPYRSRLTAGLPFVRRKYTVAPPR